jgi:hypothetical protein
MAMSDDMPFAGFGLKADGMASSAVPLSEDAARRRDHGTWRLALIACIAVRRLRRGIQPAAGTSFPRSGPMALPTRAPVEHDARNRSNT